MAWVAVAAAVVAAAVVAAVLAWRYTGSDSDGSSGGHVTPPAQVSLSGVTAWDPDGDGHEHDADAPKATDGNAATYWTTSTYYDAPSLGKPGVGLLLDAGREVDPARLAIASDTPGFHAEIEAGDSPSGPFRVVSGTKTVGLKTTFDLHDAKARYFVVWITELGGGYQHAHVNEVGAA